MSCRSLRPGSAIRMTILSSIRPLTVCLAIALTACDRDKATMPGNGTTDAKPEKPAQVPTSLPSPDSVASQAPASESALPDPDQRASYSLGYRIGASLLQEPDLQVDQAALLDGLRDSLAGRKGRISDEEMRLAGEAITARAAARAASINEDKLAEANEFLASNAKRPGILTTVSGMQYEIIKAAEDPEASKPTVRDTVEIHYHGTLADGTVFDSSIQRDEPITIAIAGVMSGWVEALQLMQVGENRRVYLPPALGYGAKGAGSVPPNSVLIFDLELRDIKTAADRAQ